MKITMQQQKTTNTGPSWLVTVFSESVLSEERMQQSLYVRSNIQCAGRCVRLSKCEGFR